MPPLRTPPMNKPIKTERSHEENQERAYIAASRRSDRSLEARLESARRASEIHKKRTGRGLRVTEQDVINEEMYEEEDDDLPAQYQRLTAHLHTNSIMFNRRLHTYLATQHAMRAGDGMSSADFTNPVIPNPYLYPMMPSFINQPILGAPMFQQPQQSNQPQSPNLSQPQQSPHQLPQHGYPHAPYLVPNRPNVHQRSASISTPQELANFQSSYFMGNGTATPGSQDLNEVPEHRRMSFPPQAFEHSSMTHSNNNQTRPSVSRSSTGTSPGGVKSESPNNRASSQAPTTPTLNGTPPKHHESSLSQSSHPLMPKSTGFNALQSATASPLTSSLPAESQQFLGAALDTYDPRTSMLMAGSEMVPQPFPRYSYNPNLSPKSRHFQASGSGMKQTLAPSPALQMATASNDFSVDNPPSAISEPIMPSYAFAFTDDDTANYTYNDMGPNSTTNSNFDNQFGSDENFEDFINLSQ